MTQITPEEFFYFIRISKKEIYEDKNTWKKSTKYYVNLFIKYPNNKFFISFNLWAFLFRETWFVFRKMYLKALTLPLLMTILFMMCLLINLDKLLITYIIIISITYFFIPGFCGNYLYINWVKKKISKNKMDVHINHNQKKSVTWIGGILAWCFLPTSLSIFIMSSVK